MVTRVAVGQALPVVGDLGANVDTAAALLRDAAAQGASLLALPEAFLTGYDFAVFAGQIPEERDLAGPGFSPLGEAARDTGATLLVSLPLLREGVARLSMIAARPDGSVTAVYDKQHLDSDEAPYFVEGEQATVLDVAGLRLGLSICYDGSFPEHAAEARALGATAYVASAAYFEGGEERQQATYAARAVDNCVPVLLASALGSCDGRAFVGGSTIFGADGRALAALADRPGIATADLP